MHTLPRWVDGESGAGEWWLPSFDFHFVTEVTRHMKPPRISQPPSRRGKRQLMVFLDAKVAKAVRTRAVRNEKTMQEMLAEGMNAALVSYGRKAVFPVGHHRFMVRKNAVALPRDAERTSHGRSGRASVSGWFVTEQLDYANAVACEMGITLQALAETGIRMVMKRKVEEEAS